MGRMRSSLPYVLDDERNRYPVDAIHANLKTVTLLVAFSLTQYFLLAHGSV
jgi:hypothetical protein